MENDANLRGESDGPALCATIGGEMGDVGVGRGTGEACTNTEAPLKTLVGDSCNESTTNAASARDVHGARKSDVHEVSRVPPVQEEHGKGDGVNNGMVHGVMGAGDAEGGAPKLGKDGASSGPAGESLGVQGGGLTPAGSEDTRLDAPCTNSCVVQDVHTGLHHASSEGLASGSDPEHSGESRSLDSLESFSNLNSCPSSDLNSEGLEDRGLEDKGLEDRGLEDRGLEDKGLEDRGLHDKRLEDKRLEDRGLEDKRLDDRGLEDRGLEDKGLALALQGEFGAEDAKPACVKDRAAGQSIYHIKWIKWREENTPIITQNENGPCPLLAIMNVLLLAWKVETGTDH